MLIDFLQGLLVVFLSIPVFLALISQGDSTEDENMTKNWAGYLYFTAIPYMLGLFLAIIIFVLIPIICIIIGQQF